MCVCVCVCMCDAEKEAGTREAAAAKDMAGKEQELRERTASYELEIQRLAQLLAEAQVEP